MANILILEDLDENFYLLNKALGNDHHLIWAKTVSEAIKNFHGDIDLALVDVALPDGDGFQFCDWIRSKVGDKKIPIIFISANSSVESRIAGFMIGGDDYVNRPFNFVELKARIDAKLRRVSEAPSNLLEVGSICADLRAQKAKIIENETTTELDLTPIEFKILNLFLADPNKAFARDEILNRVWGKDIFVYPRSVDTHVSKLRKKLGPKGSAIKSIHGFGYKFAPEKTPSPAHIIAGKVAAS